MVIEQNVIFHLHNILFLKVIYMDLHLIVENSQMISPENIPVSLGDEPRALNWFMSLWTDLHFLYYLRISTTKALWSLDYNPPIK